MSSELTEDELGEQSMSVISVDTFTTVLVDTLAKALESRDERISALEKQVVALESRALSPEYLGTFKQGETYRRGGLVTRNGGLWLCLSDTALIPGSNPTSWKLIVKSGDHAR
jgi:hypothetical protein